MTKKIILDCDPGHDDAVAIMLAAASSEIEILGITCVGGNSGLNNTVNNALKVCTLVERTDLKIYSGANKPIHYDLFTAEYVHGKTGLDKKGDPIIVNADFKAQEQNAIDFIIEACKSSSEQIYLCPTGPLTNIALSLQKDPSIKNKIKEIVFMGGAAMCLGNTTPSAEFNIYVDPQAANIVLDSGITLTMMGLDVTHQINVTQSSVQTNLQNICNGETYTINNNVYSQQGSYTDILTNSYGCDSIVNTILTVYPTHNVSNNVDICLGDSIVVGNNVYNTDGIYTDILTNGYICDSIVITYLSVSDLSSSLSLNGTDIDASALNGISPYTYDIYGPNGLLSSSTSNGGVLQFTPLINGIYYFIVTDAIGCVSDTSFMYVDFAATSISDKINFSEIDKIVDILGREVPFRKNTLLIFIYKDGTVERKILFE